MTYTRDNPSADYNEAIELGKIFHATHKTFAGGHVFHSFPLLRQLIKEHGTKDLLDYGCGKGVQLTFRDFHLLNHKNDTIKQVYPSWQEALGVDEIYMYDPCLPQYEKLPERKYGGVTCTDVLEHIPPQDMPWVVDSMFSFATQWVYTSVALYPGKKMLADGSRAHKAILSLEEWVALWSETGKRHPHVQWHIRLKIDVPPITHRYFIGQGEHWSEKEGWWPVWKPAQLETLTEKQRIEMEHAAWAQRIPIDPHVYVERMK